MCIHVCILGDASQWKCRHESYIHTHIHACYMYIHIYIHIYMYMYMYVYYTYIYIYTYTYMYIYTYIYIHIYVFVNACIYACIHTQTAHLRHKRQTTFTRTLSTPVCVLSFRAVFFCVIFFQGCMNICMYRYRYGMCVHVFIWGIWGRRLVAAVWWQSNPQGIT
jgi:hypothetical protein